MNDKKIKTMNLHDFLVESKLEEENKKQEDLIKMYFGFCNFLIDSFYFADKIHILAHLRCQSADEHEHWKKFYELIRDFADRAAEIIKGKGIEFNFSNKKIELNCTPYVYITFITEIRDYRNTLNDFYNTFNDDAGLSSLISKTIEELDHEIGMITSFK